MWNSGALFGRMVPTTIGEWGFKALEGVSLNFGVQDGRLLFDSLITMKTMQIGKVTADNGPMPGKAHPP